MNFSNYNNSLSSTGNCLVVDILPYEADSSITSGILLCVINVISSIVTTITNTIFIVAIAKTPSLQNNSNFLLCWLAFSDVFVGVFAQPSFVVSKIGELLQKVSIHCGARLFMEVVGFASSGVSMCILALISIDMYLAMYFHLRYQSFVTKKRLFSLVAVAWIFILIVATLRLFLSNAISGAIVAAGLLGNLSIILICYYNVLKIVQRHLRQIATVERPLQNLKIRTVDILKSKKLVYTMLYVVALVVLCYTPLACVIFIYIREGNSRVLQEAFDTTTTLTYMNSSINPIYCYFRMPEVQAAVAKILRKRGSLEGFGNAS